MQRVVRQVNMTKPRQTEPPAGQRRNTAV